MSITCEFMAPERVIFGSGTVQKLGGIVKEFKSQKVFLVTDEIILGLDSFQAVEESLKKEKIEYHIYADVDANPTDTQVEKGAKLFKKMNAHVLVAMGGGSSMDSAKAIGILATNKGSIADYEAYDSVANLIPPLVTVPTTAGTGSEVSGWTIITNTKDNYKMNIGGWKILPKVALVDPLMTASMPPLVTAATGMDALSHAIEAIASPFAMPQTDELAFAAIRQIVEHLGPAVANGANMEAREGMAMGAMEAGLSMNASCGGVHALGHQLSTEYGMPHGIAMGLMMPIVMSFNLIACMDKFVDIAIAMGEEVEGLSKREAARRAPLAVFELQRSLGLPTSLSEYGVDAKLIPICAKKALEDSLKTPGNPRTFTLEQVQELFEKAFEGNFE